MLDKIILLVFGLEKWSSLLLLCLNQENKRIFQVQKGNVVTLTLLLFSDISSL